MVSRAGARASALAAFAAPRCPLVYGSFGYLMVMGENKKRILVDLFLFDLCTVL
jgi:hypothetical protein